MMQVRMVRPSFKHNWTVKSLFFSKITLFHKGCNCCNCPRNNKNALILNFFAGSGTTLHAVNLLNAEDNGNRRCILVTNNEVSDEESKILRSNGYQ